jgi:hypothetical protein
MGIKIVKPTEKTEVAREEKQADEAEMMRAVQSWVKEFRLSKDMSREANFRQSQKN